MSVALYMDHQVPQAVTNGLRRRGVDVLTAFEDGAQQAHDPVLLDRATALGRVLVTQDDDLLREGGLRQQQGVPFAGIVYGHQLRVSVGQLVTDLEIIAKVTDPPDMANQVMHLPL
jgi:hypothetical protein